jgi:hypothetical protein
MVHAPQQGICRPRHIRRPSPDAQCSQASGVPQGDVAARVVETSSGDEAMEVCARCKKAQIAVENANASAPTHLELSSTGTVRREQDATIACTQIWAEPLTGALSSSGEKQLRFDSRRRQVTGAMPPAESAAHLRGKESLCGPGVFVDVARFSSYYWGVRSP